jgi:Zn-dependent protease with chaperone function
VTAGDLLLRLASAIPASLGAWATAAIFLRLLRIRDARLRAACWAWTLVPVGLALAGRASGGVLALRLVVPADHPLFRDGRFAPIALAVWAAVAAVLVTRRIVRDARLVACVEGLAAASDVPAELAAAVERAARWTGATAPRIAVGDDGGTAFVAGVRSPVLFVPLSLWDRLDVRGRRAMLLHELAHVRRRDPLRLRALSVLVAVLWPAFPLRWIAARLRDAWEAQADLEAVHGGATRSALARSLVAASVSPAPRQVLAFGGSDGETARRVAALRRPPRFATLALQVAALAVLAPWLPGWRDGGVCCRMQSDEDRGRCGVVSIGFGDGNPAAEALARLVPASAPARTPRPRAGT